MMYDGVLNQILAILIPNNRAIFVLLSGKVQVLAEDLAKPLREKMGSAQYTDVLLATCFQETVDATKVT